MGRPLDDEPRSHQGIAPITGTSDQIERSCTGFERSICRGHREGVGVVRSPVEAENLVGNLGKVEALDGVDPWLRQREAGFLADGDQLSGSSPESIGWTIGALRDQGMPSDEIATILGAGDPELIRRYFELHRERLEEHLADQRRTLARLERLLAARATVATARPQKTKASAR